MHDGNDKKNCPEFRLCVLIPYFNNPAGLLKSLESIFFEGNSCLVLIVNDGSRLVPSEKELEEAVAGKYIVKWIQQDQNRGIVYALNVGLDWIRNNGNSEYIARLDCGDICSRARFNRQVTWLQDHPESILVGSWCEFRNYALKFRYLYKTPTEDGEIRKGMYYRNLFIHPTVMWRENQAEGLKYSEEFQHTEDYGFFFELMDKGKVEILPEVLVTAEINPGGISLKGRRAQLKGRWQVISCYGNHPFRRLAGKIRLAFLFCMPASLVMWWKKRFSGT